MRVLVTGANGFIGARVVAGLGEAGHEVAAAMRHRTPVAGAGVTVTCDFSRDFDPEIWKPRLTGIDAVVNCAGILRPTHRDAFQRIHVDAPLALFRACAEVGVRRVIQLSSLGKPEDGEFIASKHRCDEALAQLDLDWLVLRPSLVYSAHGAYGGTTFLRAIAALPGALVLPGNGAQRIRPVALEDLVAAIVAALAKPEVRRQTIELVGAEVLTLRDYLSAWRRWFGLNTRRAFGTPRWLVNMTVAFGEWSGRGPLCRVISNLLERGRVGGSDAFARTRALLGREPATLARSLEARPSRAADFLQARWYLIKRLLVIVLAFVWIGSGVVGLSLSESGAQAALPDWPPAFVRVITLVSSAADLILGFALLLGWRVRLVLGLMLAIVIGYTAIIGVAAPVHWLDPFGGLLKNVPVAAVIVMLLMLDSNRR